MCFTVGLAVLGGCYEVENDWQVPQCLGLCRSPSVPRDKGKPLPFALARSQGRCGEKLQ